MEAGVRDALRAGVAVAGVEPTELFAGAGHKAQAFAAAGISTAMLLVHSVASGVSYCPDEHTDTLAIGRAIAALTTALRSLAG